MLNRVGLLTTLLDHTHQSLERDTLPTVLQAGKCMLDTGGAHTTFKVTKSTSAVPPHETIANLSKLLGFCASLLDCAPESLRQAFATTFQEQTLRAMLNQMLLPALPVHLVAVPMWIETVQQAVIFEDSLDAKLRIIKPFFDSEAGQTWASKRREIVADEVRKLIIEGWRGWEAEEVKRDKEVVIVIEVLEEVSDHSEAIKTSSSANGHQIPPSQDAEDGWAFEEGSAAVLPEAEQVEDAREGGWDFDEEATHGSRPSKSPPKRGEIAADTSLGEGDGWDFDMSAEDRLPAVQPTQAPKPTREARRLGKKAKTSSTASETASETSVPVSPSEPDDWGDWGDQVATNGHANKALDAKSSEPVKMKKVFKEEKSLLEESYFLSKACRQLVSIAEEVLGEAKQMTSMQ